MQRASANSAGETGSVAVLGLSSGLSWVMAGSGGPKGDLGGDPKSISKGEMVPSISCGTEL